MSNLSFSLNSSNYNLPTDSNVFQNTFEQETDNIISVNNDINIERMFQTYYKETELFILNGINNENSNNFLNNIKNFDIEIKSKIGRFPFVIDKHIPKPLYENDIIQIFLSKTDINEEIKNKIKNILNPKKNIENMFLQIVKQEISEKISAKTKILNIELKDNIKFGRKKKDDKTIRIHNKYSSDNIMNKIKNILKRYLILFVNKILLSLYDKQIIKKILNILQLPKLDSLALIKDIDYKSLAHKKSREENLALLNLSLRKFLSFNISTRYRKINIKENRNLFKYNKIIIEYLFKEEKNREIFNFIFNELDLEDWLDIFIRKKDLNDFPQFIHLNINQAKIIEENLIRIENIFDELYSEGEIYFVCFILLIYNYKRYFLIKPERKNKNFNL